MSDRLHLGLLKARTVNETNSIDAIVENNISSASPIDLTF